MGPRDPSRIIPLAAALLLVASPSPLLPPTQAKRVGVLGGGISGTFAARYLAGHDVGGGGGGGGCALDEIVVFDVSPPPGDGAGRSSSDPRPPARQGSRVASVTLADGSTVELGASIIYEGNRLVVEMMEGDPDNLAKGEPMNQGRREQGDDDGNRSGADLDGEEEPSGIGIYDGEKRWALNTAGLFPYLPSPLRRIAVPLYMLWRYNLDYLRLRRAVAGAVLSFDSIYVMLNDTSSDVTYFSSPSEMWEAVGLDAPSRISYGELLDALGVSRCGGAGRFLGMGCLRDELLAATTINTYNQDPDGMNGLVGLVSHVPVEGELFSVIGGNYQLMESAMRQARRSYSDCGPNGAGGDRIRWQTATVGSVVGTEDTLDVYSRDGDLLGKFDAVILAAPLQQARIDFLVESPGGLDGSVLHPMPLAGLHSNGDPDDEEGGGESDSEGRGSESNEHGHRLFAPPLPPVATDPYASVVTTVVSNATLNAAHFGLPPDGPWPRTIFVTARGRDLEGISTLTILSKARGLVKTFSTDELDHDKRMALFGPYHVLEYEQAWGGRDSGRHGGSVPSFVGGRSRDDSMPYLLYDGGSHWGKVGGRDGPPHAGPALYYANAVEGSAAAIEISAIGASSVAKLLARRLGMIGPDLGGDGDGRDEL